ncbi:MAG TPA: phosphonate metabolism protein/1,5-bisphosphokinase (PRPP-forming) PhnN [Puia sp.]|nr:phosphonate metabolism protein/1,5-bisphosphokinase (PRPP-forming) PhnN [Puia sp.]
MPQLFYIVGASGVGKDSLMEYARLRINGSMPVLFAHRYITRPPREGNENHVYVSPEEFRLRRDKGLFALHWVSHGLYYGIGKEIDTWMENGFHVVVNGSRQYLPVALDRYPALVTIVIEADPDVIRRRLESRGRETAADIEQRIKRQPEHWSGTSGRISIRNNGSLEEGGDALISTFINQLQNK